jgi:hypothetical protein
MRLTPHISAQLASPPKTRVGHLCHLPEQPVDARDVLDHALRAARPPAGEQALQDLGLAGAAQLTCVPARDRERIIEELVHRSEAPLGVGTRAARERRREGQLPLTTLSAVSASVIRT